MVQDEPVTVSQRSIQQILRLVEDTLSNDRSITSPPAQLTPAASTGMTPLDAPGELEQPAPNPNFQFPSLHAGSHARQFIHFNNLPVLPGERSFADPVSLDGSAASYGNPLPYFQNDVVTTDLFNFFPIDLMSPYNTSSLEGADNHNT